ncbi:MAG: protein-glutamate O-methyltransferase CheR [Xanthobacteraceae bacterium]
MSPFDYEYLCKMLKDRSGLVLAPEKQYLVESRLMPVARRNECNTISDLLQHIKGPGSDGLRVEVTEAMMNNESFFFRDKIPFDRVQDTVLPDLLQKRARTRRIRIWSAAASTGQEPYSLALMLAGWPGLAGWQIDIVATDISNDALEQAKSGVYSQFEVQRGLPIQMLMRYFEQIDEQWRIADKFRNMVHFRQLNLLNDFSILGMFDVVFCRNVLIYFDQATKLDVLGRVRRVIAADGYLVLGAAETMVGLGDCFMPVPEKRGLYRPKPRVETAGVLKPVPGGVRVA